MKKFKYWFDRSLNILIKYYYGSITIDDIESSWEYAFENHLIPKDTRGFLLDYGEATFDVSLDEHQAIPDFYKNHLDVFGELKIAVVTENHTDIIIPTLVEMRSNGVYSKPFSTPKAEIHWLLN